jgi:hypothetical protein
MLTKILEIVSDFLYLMGRIQRPEEDPPEWMEQVMHPE